MAQNEDILKAATRYFKEQHPGLTPEAIIGFLVVASMETPTVGDVARALGMTEPGAYQSLSGLVTGPDGVGLISFENPGDGRNIVHLTDAGRDMKAMLEVSLAGICYSP